ncbi:hypothetical protein F7725_021180 [Dissostichus mawsoni]|uniref:SKICH domain-containing protein n=1 Tax=Dissostichus mawsoni TaxID=36200 RepID=A0A7J5YFA8_DISMA|nr:hypothetical protein F7725_021180 [Dissostichus mawsoni]
MEILWRLQPAEEEEGNSALEVKEEEEEEEEEEKEEGGVPAEDQAGFLKKRFTAPLVRVKAEGEWSSDLDAVVLYRAMQPFPSSSWDWIGLFKVGFSSVTDYITYTWVKDDEMNSSEEATQVYVSKEEIPVWGGDCVLCYYSGALQCVIGVSEPFKVAIEEGFSPERINDLDQIVAGEDFHQ